MNETNDKIVNINKNDSNIRVANTVDEKRYYDDDESSCCLNDSDSFDRFDGRESASLNEISCTEMVEKV